MTLTLHAPLSYQANGAFYTLLRLIQLALQLCVLPHGGANYHVYIMFQSLGTWAKRSQAMFIFFNKLNTLVSIVNFLLSAAPFRVN